jgi:hypothetical protein
MSDAAPAAAASAAAPVAAPVVAAAPVTVRRPAVRSDSSSSSSSSDSSSDSESESESPVRSRAKKPRLDTKSANSMQLQPASAWKSGARRAATSLWSAWTKGNEVWAVTAVATSGPAHALLLPTHLGAKEQSTTVYATGTRDAVLAYFVNNTRKCRIQIELLNEGMTIHEC